MFKTFTANFKALRLSVRRQPQAEQVAEQLAEVENRRKADLIALEADKREAAALRLQAYNAHVKGVDLNGIASLNGAPLKLSELPKEVDKRLMLAAAAKRDPQINLVSKMSDEHIAAVTNKLDQTALDWLWEQRDPERQRNAAVAILNARADLDTIIPLDLYVTIVAEAVARSREKIRPMRTIVVVIVRAVLLRSIDPRWTRTRNGELRPLSEPHW